MPNTNRRKSSGGTNIDEKMPNKIMCCSQIYSTTIKAPPAEPNRIAERLLYFLCSGWSDKEPEQDTDAYGTQHLCAANFAGVIRLSYHPKENDTKSGEPSRAATNPEGPSPDAPSKDVPNLGNANTTGHEVPTRWFACYSPGHAKASQVALIGNKGTGPDGKYMQISEDKALSAVGAGRLVHTYIEMQYGNCINHKAAVYLGRWFEFRNTEPEIGLPPQVVNNGILVDLTASEPTGTKRCSKCRGQRSLLEFRVNIFNAAEKPKFCFGCQWYRSYSEPIRRSRANDATDKQSTPRGGRSGNVCENLVANSYQAPDSSGVTRSNETVSSTMVPDDNGLVNSIENVNSSPRNGKDQLPGNSGIIKNSLTPSNGYLLSGSGVAYSTPVIDDKLALDSSGPPFDAKVANYSNTCGGSQIFDGNLSDQCAKGFNIPQDVNAGGDGDSIPATAPRFDLNTMPCYQGFSIPDDLIDPSLRSERPPQRECKAREDEYKEEPSNPAYEPMDDDEHDSLYIAD